MQHDEPIDFIAMRELVKKWREMAAELQKGRKNHLSYEEGKAAAYLACATELNYKADLRL